MPDVFISNYRSIMLFWLLYDCNVNVSTPHPATELSLTHITRRDKGSLSPRTFKHSELLYKTMYLVINFISNLRTYGKICWRMNATQGGANLHLVVNLLPGANLHAGANCAHEHGIRESTSFGAIWLVHLGILWKLHT